MKETFFLFLALTTSCSRNTEMTYEPAHMIKPLKVWSAGTEFYVLGSAVDCSYCYVHQDGIRFRPETSSLYLRHSVTGTTWETLSKTDSQYGESAALAPDGSIRLVGYARGQKIDDSHDKTFTYNWDPGFFSASKTGSQFLGFSLVNSLSIPTDELYRWCTTLAVDELGTQFAGCRSTRYDWSLRKSTDDWYTFRKRSSDADFLPVDHVDFIDKIANPFAVPYASIATSSGSILIGGNSNLSGVVRRSSDRGTSWTTVDQFTPAGNLQFSEVRSFFQRRNGTLLSLTKAYRNQYAFLQSYIKTTGPAYYTIVKQSADDGLTWSELATGFSGTTFPEQFLGAELAEDSNGNLFLVGSIYTTQGASETAKWGENNRYWKWTVLKSTDAGVTWSLSDQVSTFKANGATHIAINSEGTIVVVGTKKDEYLGDKHNCHVHIRGSTDGGASWKIFDSDGGPAFN